MIQAVMRITFSPESRPKALELISSIIERIRVSPGCISYGVYQDLMGKNSLTILEEWRSKADLDRFICSDEYRSILALMELANQSPKILFYELQKIGEMEVIENLRKAISI